jgi:nitroreductase
MTEQTQWQHPFSELVRERYSCRTYDGRGIPAQLGQDLLAFMSQLPLPFATAIRPGIIDRKQVLARHPFTTGTYGMFRGARHFLAGIVPKQAPRCWEDLGFLLQSAIIQATDLGWNTCWIGGMFDRKRFGRQLAMNESEIIPAVVVIGRAAEKRSWQDRLVRRTARASMRKAPPELFFVDDLQTTLAYEKFPDMQPILENVRLAPSASNKQPWRIIFRAGAYHFFLDRDRAYAKLIPQADLQRIDMGIAMCHFHFSLQERGRSGEWFVEPPAIAGLPENFEYIVSSRVP